MANVVKLKRSAVSGKVPSISALQLGEVALNTYDGNLFFKKEYSDPDAGSIQQIVEVVTTDGTQTLSNKTFNGTTLFNDGIDLSGTESRIVDDQGSDGSSNQILISTGQGVRWVTNSAGNLSGLGDVSLNGVTSGQIIKYNGTVWVNADENAVVTSAVFAANASSDLGLVTDSNLDQVEDLEPEHETETQPNGMGDTDAFYNLGNIAIDGVVGLRNVDQSLKSDYISYSIIFGF
jgi:hypothetical protein